eukprot:Blabericola_migrator_1__4747@NODE_24_length_21460_cov_93_666994_g21_i0_p8_GENE_NODE_24_length_21460_cov_93_666994_g21_i0NODE_24_length_21460_cov_93_666994_g21_i0_p8_ORF_typecomplete_len303_score58_52UPF0160/PF03690_13/1_4e41_NODE_24_length_21460_cov_93_666994_g21_i059336841
MRNTYTSPIKKKNYLVNVMYFVKKVLCEAAGLGEEALEQSKESETEFFGPLQEKAGVPIGFVGRLWKQEGINILKNKFNVTDEGELRLLLPKVYEDCLVAVDGYDNRVRRCGCDEPHPIMSVLNFANLVTASDPDRAGIDFDDPEREAKKAAAKEESLRITRECFERIVSRLAQEYAPAANIMEQAFKEMNSADRVLFLSHYVPWQTHIYDFEDALNLDESTNVHWVVFQDDRSLQWRGTAVAERGDRFKNRALVHPTLRGLRDEELCEKSGIEGVVFVHPTGFTCGASTKEAVLRLMKWSE